MNPNHDEKGRFCEADEAYTGGDVTKGKSVFGTKVSSVHVPGFENKGGITSAVGPEPTFLERKPITKLSFYHGGQSEDTKPIDLKKAKWKIAKDTAKWLGRIGRGPKG